MVGLGGGEWRVGDRGMEGWSSDERATPEVPLITAASNVCLRT